MSQKPVDVIIPTFLGAKAVCDVTGQPMLVTALQSLLACGEFYPTNVILVDNGNQDLASEDERVRVIKMRRNVGWERGLIEGLKISTADFVVFANDDIFVPAFSRWWIRDFVTHMKSDKSIAAMGDFVTHMKSDKSIAAMGPSSNVVAGPQNIWLPMAATKMDVAWLIGFCVMYRRSVLDEIGGVDDTLPGGDDLDLGIRCRRAGYRIVADRSHFIYHHGFKTGNVVHGGPEKEGGWNSPLMSANTNAALLEKHGEEEFKKLWSIPGESISPKIEQNVVV